MCHSTAFARLGRVFGSRFYIARLGKPVRRFADISAPFANRYLGHFARCDADRRLSCTYPVRRMGCRNMSAADHMPRGATPNDIMPTAQLWYDAWHETQAPFVPQALIDLRSLASFKARLLDMGDLLRVAGDLGAPLGMCAIKLGEMHQLFVSPSARGTGIAAALLADAELRLQGRGHTSAHLDCLIENDAARRFYARNGWLEQGVEIAHLDTADGPFDLPCLVFKKDLKH